MRASLEERFWSKVDRRGPDDCWPWTAGLGGGGDRYGYIRVSPTEGAISAPRLALILDGRDPGHGGVTRHTCDNPLCVNPAHLISGTQAANLDDMARRLRNGRKLDGDQAAEIRRRLAAGERQRPLAAEFGVSQPMISKIKRERNWRYAA